jgi:hypothetical protein
MNAAPEPRRILALLSQLPATERDSLLRATCGDDPGLLTALERALGGEALPQPLPATLDATPWSRLEAELEARSPRRGEASLAGTHLHHLRVEERIGRGGMGEVYRGFDERLRRRVAIKALGPRQQLRPAARARFLREARILAQLEHPGLCQIYDLIEAEGLEYLVLELVEGASLRDTQSSLSAEEQLEVAAQLADAMAAAHRAGVVHRDLKPDNVMLTPAGRVRVLDFGIARLAAASPTRSDAAEGGAAVPAPAEEPRANAAVTHSAADAGPDATAFETALGSVLGTVRYMSPEQARGEEVGPASDVYSLGVLLHELFAGCPPYPESLSRQQLLEWASQGRAQVSPQLDPARSELLRSLLQPDPRLRPVAEAVADGLRRIREAPRLHRRRRRAVAGGLVAAAILLASAGAVVHARLQARRQAGAARQLAHASSEITWRMRAERLAPAHDLRPAEAAVRERIGWLEQRTPELGAVATGAGSAALGRAYLELGEMESARRHLATARVALDDSDALRAGDARTLLRRAELAALTGRWQARRGGDGTDAFDRAEAWLAELTVDRPDDPRVPRLRAEASLWRARSRAHRGQDPEAAIAEGLRAVEELLALDPGSATAKALRGSLLELAAGRATGAERTRLRAAAAAAFAEACRANPDRVAACASSREAA